jgi:hypothetical protein
MWLRWDSTVSGRSTAGCNWIELRVEETARQSTASPSGASLSPKHVSRCLKFARVLAIGKVLRVSCIYSDDHGVRAVGHREGLPVIGIGDITVPMPGSFKLTPPNTDPD